MYSGKPNIEHFHSSLRLRKNPLISSVCRNCGKVFAYAFNMIRHRRNCEGQYHLQCVACGKLFYRRDVYAAHLRTIHGLRDDKKSF